MGLYEQDSVGDHIQFEGPYLDKGRMKDPQPSMEISYHWTTNLPLKALIGLCQGQSEVTEGKGRSRATYHPEWLGSC